MPTSKIQKLASAHDQLLSRVKAARGRLSKAQIAALGDQLVALCTEIAKAIRAGNFSEPQGLDLTRAGFSDQTRKMSAQANVPGVQLPKPPHFRSHTEVNQFYRPLLEAAVARMEVAKRSGFIPLAIAALRPDIEKAWNKASQQVRDDARK